MKEFEDHESEDVPDFDDPAYDDLRALLGDTPVPAMPADVAARLDATLADLVAGSGSTVVPLRRRRPLGQRLLVAAAAVVLLGAGGVGLTQVLDRTSQNDSRAASTAQADTAAEAPAAPGLSAPEVTSDSLSGLGANLQRESYATAQRLAGTEFTRAGFAQQVRHFVNETARASDYTADADGVPAETPAPTVPENQSGTGGTSSGSESPEPAPVSGEGPWADTYDRDLKDLSAATKASPTCAGPSTPEGAVSLRITYEDQPAVLVLHPATAGSRYVAAWSCDGHQLLTYATIPA